MKALYYLLAVCSVLHSVIATVEFGSLDAGFVVSSNASLEVGNAAFTNGSLKNAGGFLTSNNGALACSRMAVQADNHDHVASMMVSGEIDFGSSIQLGSNQQLEVAGGLVEGQVTVQGPLAAIVGSGQFDHEIIIADDAALDLDWATPLNVDIVVGDNTIISFKRDFAFATGHRIAVDNPENSLTLMGSRYTLSCGGDENSPVMLSGQNWFSLHLDCIGPVAVGDYPIVFGGSGSLINGAHNTVTIRNNGIFDNNNNVVTIVDAVVQVKNNNHFQGTGEWRLQRVTFEDVLNGTLTIDGSLTNSLVNLFYGQADFGANTRILLESTVVVGGSWHFGSNNFLDGSGHILNCTSGTLVLAHDVTCVNTVFTNINADSFDNSLGSSLFLSNVQMLDRTHAGIRVNGLSTQDKGCECWISNVDSSQGNIFTNNEVRWHQGVIELLSDISLSSVWVAEEDGTLIVEGGGHKLDLQYGSLAAAADARLVLRNVVLNNVNNDSFTDYSGIIELANVTVVLSDDVDLSAYDSYFLIKGPVTFITGAHAFTVNEASIIDGVTVYYDTLSESDDGSVNGFSSTNDGRVLFIQTPPLSSRSEYAGVVPVTVYLDRDDFLVAYDGSADDRTILFSGIITYEGQGHTLTFSQHPQPVLLFSSDTSVVVRSVFLDGILPAHFSSGVYSINFGNCCHMRLQQNWTLNKTVYFGSENSNEEMVIDLNNHTIDMADELASLYLVGGSGSVLRICNGSITNLAYNKLLAVSGTKIILENVSIVLADNASYANAALQIEGACSISGSAGSYFQFTSTDLLTIAPGASLTIEDGVGYYHHNVGTSNLVFGDRTSTLGLSGGTFKARQAGSSRLTLLDGTLLVDGASTINVGPAGIALGDETHDFFLETRPSARINFVGSGLFLCKA